MNMDYQSQKPKECRITPVIKHFTEKGYSGRDMQFSLLERCSLKYNTAKSDHTKMREKWWNTSNWYKPIYLIYGSI